VYFYGEPHATVSVQEDGQKVWTLDGWANFQLDHDTQTKIEMGIDHAPHIARLHYARNPGDIVLQQRPVCG